MRCLTRMGLGLVGLALVAPTAVWADPPASQPATGKKPRPKPMLFHKAHLCSQCQWADLRSKGINVPPPPPMPRGGQSVPGTACERCGAATGTYAVPPMVSSEAPPAPPITVMSLGAPPSADVPPPPVVAGPGAPARGGMSVPGTPCVACEAAMGAPSMPGRAVAGGGTPGYAVISGAVPQAEPMPIGVVQGRYAYQDPGTPMGPSAAPMPGGYPGAGQGPGMGQGPGRPGSNDPSVMPSSFAPTPYAPGRGGRPHVISHMLGLDAIGSRHRADRERRERENHASITYQPQSQPVVDLPATMVYGR